MIKSYKILHRPVTSRMTPQYIICLKRHYMNDTCIFPEMQILLNAITENIFSENKKYQKIELNHFYVQTYCFTNFPTLVRFKMMEIF